MSNGGDMGHAPRHITAVTSKLDELVRSSVELVSEQSDQRSAVNRTLSRLHSTHAGILQHVRSCTCRRETARRSIAFELLS